ncbi:single-stranded DNA-binding protein [Candidatus Dojkabacteria bacterium]|jgi:single-strand DNA-binding protein|nr:single-stranded DNA-binding protein [Candidatus Dojkabacteria bacterium]
MSARSLNLVQLIGNLTRDPELRYTTGGSAVATFGIATNKSWKDEAGELKELAEFHNVVAWGKLAEICQQLLGKGMKVYIQGSLTTRNWVDEASGVTKYKTEVRVDDMILLDSKGRQGAGMDEGEAPVAKEEEVEQPKKKSSKKAAKEPVKEEENSDPLAEDLPF